MPDMISKLLSHWAEAGALPAGGTTDADVEVFEKTHNVQMPNDLRSYFLKVNGMRQDSRCDQDANGFTFWPLAKLLCLGTLVYPGSGGSVHGPRFFVFAD